MLTDSRCSKSSSGWGLSDMTDILKARIARRYKRLLPIEGRSLSANEREQLKPLGLDDRVVFSRDDLMKQVFLYSLLSNGELVGADVLSAYELIDIFLEKTDRYGRLLDITPKVLCLYVGYNEFTNKRLEEAVLQVISNQKIHRNHVWVFVRGDYKSFSAKYPLWYRAMKDGGFKEITLGTGRPCEEDMDI